MESPEPAEKVAALEAELAAKSSRIAELEARVSTLEAENSRLRKGMAKEEAAGLPGEEDTIFGLLDEDSGGHKQTTAGKLGGGVGNVIVLSDGEEGIAVNANKRTSAEDGVVIPTPQKRALRVVAAESEDEAVGDAEGGGESYSENARRDNNVDLEDDDVLVTASGKKRAAALVVSSDCEDENVNRGDPGSAEDDDNAKEEDAMPIRKRALRGVSDSEEDDGNEGVHVAGSKRPSHLEVTDMESEDEDDNIPICQVLKKIRKERLSEDADYDELGAAKGCCTPATRRSARSVKNQSKKGRAVRRMLDFDESEESEGSDDDDMDDFINDEDSPERASGSAEESCAETEVSDASAPNEELSPESEESDSEINYADVIAYIGRKRNTKDWKLEGEMLAAFEEHPELCLKAVCALYRRQTEEEKREKATIVHNKEGFSQIDATRASYIAEFLLDGDPYGPIKKTVRDLEGYDRYALNFCRKVASRYSEQLFAIYQSQEDPHFHL